MMIQWKMHWTHAFNEQSNIRKLTGEGFGGQTHAALMERMSECMFSSFNNLAMAAV